MLALLLMLSPAPVEVAAQLESLRRPTSVHASFTQRKTMKAFRAPQEAKGEVIMAKGRKLRWAYTAPYRMVLVQGGDRVSMSYPELGRKQAFDLAKNPEMKAVFETILFFQQAEAKAVAARFDATQAPDGHLVLSPRKAGELLKQVEVWIDAKRGVLTRVRLLEPDGDATDLRFAHIRVDQPIDEALLTP